MNLALEQATLPNSDGFKTGTFGDDYQRVAPLGREIGIRAEFNTIQQPLGLLDALRVVAPT